MLIIIFLIILTPLVLAANILMGEAIHLYLYVKNLDVTLLAEPISKYLPAVNTEEYIKEALKEISSVIVNTLRNFVLSVPKLLLNLFIILFTLFYLFKDKERAYYFLDGHFNEFGHELVSEELLRDIKNERIQSFTNFFLL